MHCINGNAMSEVWAVIVVAILALIVYGIVSSKRAIKRQREAREKVLPYVDEAIVPKGDAKRASQHPAASAATFSSCENSP